MEPASVEKIVEIDSHIGNYKYNLCSKIQIRCTYMHVLKLKGFCRDKSKSLLAEMRCLKNQANFWHAGSFLNG